jgi:hypothetical protein
MKKMLFSAILLLFAIQGFAQTQFGLYLSPSLSANRVNGGEEGAYKNISYHGVSPKISFGPTVDYMFSDNASVHTGIIYAPKNVNIRGTFNEQMIEEEHVLQYLQVPVGVKFYTNELALDTKMYFNIGGLAEVKISEKADKREVIEGFSLFDSSVVLGAGVERQVGASNILYAGLSYKRGLVNVAKTPDATDGSLSIKNDLVGVDLGIKF